MRKSDEWQDLWNMQRPSPESACDSAAVSVRQRNGFYSTRGEPDLRR